MYACVSSFSVGMCVCVGDFAVIMKLYSKEPQWWVTLGDTSLSSIFQKLFQLLSVLLSGSW